MIRRHLVIESSDAPACQQVIEMSAPIHSFPAEVRVSPRIRSKRDTSGTCRERASADLLKSLTMVTANERMILERSSACWTQRALLLERVEGAEKDRRGSSSEGLRA